MPGPANVTALVKGVVTYGEATCCVPEFGTEGATNTVNWYVSGITLIKAVLATNRSALTCRF